MDFEPRPAGSGRGRIEASVTWCGIPCGTFESHFGSGACRCEACTSQEITPRPACEPALLIIWQILSVWGPRRRFENGVVIARFTGRTVISHSRLAPLPEN